MGLQGVVHLRGFIITPHPLTPKIFYPFGSAAGDTRNPAVEDGSSSVIQLSSPFLFFGRTYRQIYVNNNGHLTFNQPSSAYTPYSFPSNGSQDIIAGLWTDLDNRVKGVVSYQQYTIGSVLTNVTQDINTYFPNLNFNASWVFVATWNKVAYFNLTNTETSFQVVLISGSNYSFILMNYGDIAVTDHPVQAGYDTINSTQYFVIPGSNNGSSISNLRNSSNVNVPGRWAFRVDSGSRNSILKTLPYDPCYNYTVLDDLRRATSNQLQSSYYAQYTSKLLCDTNVNWVGWYRLFIQGQSVQMPDTCVDQLSCGTHAPLWLNGSHPQIEDGVVTRDVCGHWWNNCCGFRSNPIRVKACPGNYYVYEFVRPNFCYGTYCAAPAIFYPFGSAAGDTNSTAVDDGDSSVIQLLSPFLFFGRTYQQIYVNNNGYLTFNQASNEYVPYSFSTYGSQDIIAGLWTDLDNRVRGVVSYQQYTNGSVLTNATQDINTYFPNLNFTASWVFVATWNKVAYYALTSTVSLIFF
ncbi:dendrite extension defective protein 1-like [Garra rufa]|uniref:dendrite extension defective protein 1-like n=1 Tax=Garra rufa TaxID=137080 RepID=UPI003CCEAC26